MSFTVVHARRSPGDREGQTSQHHKLTEQREPQVICRGESPNRTVSVRGKPLPPPPVPKKVSSVALYVTYAFERIVLLERASFSCYHECLPGGIPLFC